MPAMIDTCPPDGSVLPAQLATDFVTNRLFTFPNPVDEISARLVAGGVVLMCVVTLVFDQPWLAVVIAYGFAARVMSGPTLSPLGLLVTRVVRPRLDIAPRLVPGPPKRFAQAIGLVFSAAALVLIFGAGATAAGYAVLGLLAVAAALESFFGVCLGCWIFARLMRLGIIPQPICEACENVWLTRARRN